MRDRLEQTILSQVESTGVNGQGAPRVPNTSSIYFDCIEGEALVIALDLKGLAVSTGAACSSGAIEPSHVLTAMGMRPEQARGSLRFSLGKQNTPEDDRIRIWASSSRKRYAHGCESSRRFTIKKPSF